MGASPTCTIPEAGPASWGPVPSLLVPTTLLVSSVHQLGRLWSWEALKGPAWVLGTGPPSTPATPATHTEVAGPASLALRTVGQGRKRAGSGARAAALAQASLHPSFSAC